MSPALTDFSTTSMDGGPPSFSNSTGKWGIAGNLTGSIFGYRGPKTSATDWPTPMVANGALVGAGTVRASDYAGIGMSFDQCVNSSKFTGVSFTLTGSTGGCTLQFQLQTLDQQAKANNGLCDTCMNTCYIFPKTILNVVPTATPQVVTVMFTDLENTGLPALAADFEKEMIGFEWRLQAGASGACSGASLAVSDVAFVP
jgi:hypothetical protein